MKKTAPSLMGAALLAGVCAIPALAQNPRLQAQPESTDRPAAAAAVNIQTQQPQVSAPTPTTPLVEAPPLADAQATETQLNGGVAVFGQWLFQGKFAQESFHGYNPDYVISIGDVIDLRLWGAFTFAAQIPVDAQGNIFIPQVGPVQVTNTRNGDLNQIVRAKIKTVYREDVGVYATLAASQPVKVFVSGYVRRPGLYAAAASDSLLHFLDRAGGVDPRSGSFLDVRVMRGGEVTRRVNLYDFLLSGKLPLMQFRDGDTIFVGPIRSTVLVSGLVTTPTQFEFDGDLDLHELLVMAGVSERATDVRVTRNQGSRRDVDYQPITAELSDYPIQGGDEIEVLADRLIGNIIVNVEGEHEGSGSFVLPYRATLQDLLDRVRFSDRSQRDSLQLYRKSVATRQKQMLEETLRKLEQAVLSARSSTREEATLRVQEAQLILQFIDRARKIEPRGQFILPHDADPSLITLEDGDVIRIPRNSNLVTVHGEVYFPNAFLHKAGMEVEHYIAAAGGMTQHGDDSRILILRQNGEISTTKWHGFMDFTRVLPGDEILVLPQVDRKSFQLTKDIVEVVYQIAIAAGVILRL